MAWTCSDYADALIQRNGQGDSSKAQSLLDESLAIATELGMRPLMERVSDRLGRVPAQPAATPTYPGGLTAREVEVLRLVASGKTNLEIAEELVIAEGTARRHVANIYEKIGAANRVEAATYAARQGLVPVDGQNSTA
jgi:DNA-binding NarL/FixJ family response regulator